MFCFQWKDSTGKTVTTQQNKTPTKKADILLPDLSLRRTRFPQHRNCL